MLAQAYHLLVEFLTLAGDHPRAALTCIKISQEAFLLLTILPLQLPVATSIIIIVSLTFAGD